MVWRLSRGSDIVFRREGHVDHGPFPMRFRALACSRWFNGRPVVALSAARSDLPRLRSGAAHQLGPLVLHAAVDPATRSRAASTAASRKRSAQPNRTTITVPCA